MKEPHLNSIGGLSYLARTGPGPTVVLLHGIGSNATSFAHLLNTLPTHLNLVAWNAPGYLDSEPLPQDWPMAEDYARRLAQFLEDLELSTVNLVGHSLGTLIAASFARHFPERVDSLLLASSAKGYGVARGSELSAGVAARLDDLARLGPAAFAAGRAANLVHDPVNNPDVVSRVEATMAQINQHGYSQAVRMLASGDLLQDLTQVDAQPAFVIGANDKVTPLEQTRDAASAWANAHSTRPKISEIEQAGHAVYLQKPDAFRAILVDQLASAMNSMPEGVES